MEMKVQAEIGVDLGLVYAHGKIEDKDEDSVYRTDSARSCRIAAGLLFSFDKSTFAL